MLNINNKEEVESFKLSLIKAKKEGNPFFYKNIIDTVPDWSSFLQCTYDLTNRKNEIIQKTADSKRGEVAVGSVHIRNSFYISPHTSNADIETYFKEVLDIYNIINEAFGITFEFRGPKISIGEHFFGLHQDPLDAYTIHCQGSTKWTIESANGVITEYDLNPGDFLFFPQKAKHGLLIDKPRAGLIFFGNIDPNF